jgi:hypothetical protein
MVAQFQISTCFTPIPPSSVGLQITSQISTCFTPIPPSSFGLQITSQISTCICIEISPLPEKGSEDLGVLGCRVSFFAYEVFGSSFRGFVQGYLNLDDIVEKMERCWTSLEEALFVCGWQVDID